MNDPLAIRAYYGVLSQTFSAKVDLATLLTAAYAAISNAPLVPPIAGCEITIFADGNNGKDVLVGDELVTTTNYAYILTAGSSRRYGPGRMSAVPMGDIYVMSSDGTTGIKLGIEVLPT